MSLLCYSSFVRLLLVLLGYFPSGFLALLFPSATELVIWYLKAEIRVEGKLWKKQHVEALPLESDNRQKGSSRLTLLNLRNSAKSRQLLR